MKRHSLHSTLAIALALSVAMHSIADANERDDTKVIEEQHERGRHLIKLRSEHDLRDVVARAQSLDGSSQVLRQSRLIPEYVWLEITTGVARELRGMEAVRKVVAPAPSDAVVNPDAFALSADFPTTADTTAPPLSDDPRAGEGVRVAIVSTGVDYTHALVGGDGSTDTYAEAVLNMSTAWDGFPTDVVVGGLDVNSEDGQLDPNPIELSKRDISLNPSDWPQVPLGRGTVLASVIHQLAPGAELLAYKTWRVAPSGRRADFDMPTHEELDRVFTHVLDPNGDGDASDRADIVLLDTLGGFAFFNPYEEYDSTDASLIDFVQALAGHGVLVVTDSGVLVPNSPYTTSWIGASPDALTVAGLIELASDEFIVSPSAARGPVRGEPGAIKPDMVSHGRNITGADVGTGTGTISHTNNHVAAARIAAAAAILKAERRELTALELKTLLANTANNDVRMSMGEQMMPADVNYIGLGRENLAAALSSPALVYTEDSRQPSINFGFQEFGESGQVVRNLVIRNLSDSDLAFSANHRFNDDKPNNRAISFNYPSTITVPAQRQVTIPVGIVVDPGKLEPWPLVENHDYSPAAWRSVHVNGYLELTSENADTLNVGWMVTPRAKINVVKDFTSIVEFSDSPLKEGFDEFVIGLSQEFENASPHAARFAALPQITGRTEVPGHLADTYGHILRHVSGGVFDEPACTETGKKLVIAATMHRPMEIPIANYFDKVGDALFYFEIFSQEAVEAYGYDDGINGENVQLMQDEDYINRGFITVDINGIPQTVTFDLDKEYDPLDPTGRYQVSTLPSYVSPHSRNAVAQVCVDDLLHHDQTLADYDKNLGFTIATDRDVLPRANDPIIRYNPVRYGKLAETCNFFGDCFFYNTGIKGTLESATEADPDAPEFNPFITIASHDRGKLTTIQSAECNGFGSSSKDCGSDLIFIGLNSDLAMTAKFNSSEGTVLAPPVAGQDFSVSEDAEAGTLVGLIEADSNSFFQPGPGYDNFEIYAAAALPGEPFKVEPDGSILVKNPASIDYEMTDKIILPVRTKLHHDFSKVVEVDVYVKNVNDVAPVYLGGLVDLELTEGDEVHVQLPAYFADEEGDALTFVAEGLPEGLEIDASGVLQGEVTKSGSSAVTVTVSDGVHTTGAAFDITVKANTNPPAPPAPTRSSGGGGGPIGLWMLGLLLACLPRIRPIH